MGATPLQAKFAARLRTTPAHRRAVESHKTAARALARAEGMVAITEGTDPFWVSGVEFWGRRTADLANDIRWADLLAEDQIHKVEADTK